MNSQSVRCSVFLSVCKTLVEWPPRKFERREKAGEEYGFVSAWVTTRSALVPPRAGFGSPGGKGNLCQNAEKRGESKRKITQPKQSAA